MFSEKKEKQEKKLSLLQVAYLGILYIVIHLLLNHYFTYLNISD